MNTQINLQDNRTLLIVGGAILFLILVVLIVRFCMHALNPAAAAQATPDQVVQHELQNPQAGITKTYMENGKAVSYHFH